jgi:tripartite-type tricarboxylate transporter receptor subunit TctC
MRSQEGKIMKRFVEAALLFFCIMGIAGLVMAADEPYPNRAITIAHSTPVGGSTDLVARALATVAPKYFGQPMIVVSKPGGAGLIALQALASSKPDGYYMENGRMGDMVNAAFFEKMPFDMENDFIPVCGEANDELLITVSAKSGFKNIDDLIAAAKKNPGKVQFAASGTTNSGRLIFEAWADAMGLEFEMVPFKGAAPAAIAVAGGHVPVLNSTISECLAHVQRGDLVPLMMMGNRRAKEFPNVPIPKDKGLKFDMTSWHGIWVVKGTPQPIVAKIEANIKKIVADPDYIKALDTMGTMPIFTPQKEFTEYVKSERKKMGALIKKLGLSNTP